MAPAGGDTTSPLSMASRSVSRSDSSMRCSNEASTTTVMTAGILFGVGAHRLVELRQAGERPSFGGQVRPVHHDVMGSANGALQQIGLLQLVQGGTPDGRAGRFGPAHVAQPQPLGQAGVEAGVDEGPGPHVLRLFLQPHHLSACA
jgi:hypothetical protein